MAIRHGKFAARAIHYRLAEKHPNGVIPKAHLRVAKNGPITRHYQDGYYVGTSSRLCKGCNLCVNSCPTEILSLDAKSKISISDMSKCVFCGMCEMRCPDFAIWVVKEDREHPVEVEAKRRLKR
jgi:2-oxoglutarate ferredoxin oxidoreductase subunit delta